MAVTSTSGTRSNQAVIDYANSQNSSTTSQISEAQDRFLKLLTTQLKNQDPLNPLDNAQVTSQLAQISTVSGIEKLNSTLQLLMSGMQDSQATQAASLVGHGVLVPGTTLQLTSGSAVGGIELEGAADNVTVTVKDANGIVVRTLSLGAQTAGVHNFAWDGKADNGAQAADGNYSISVSAKQGSNEVKVSALSLAAVRSVLRNGQGFTLDLGALGTFTMDDVKQIL